MALPADALKRAVVPLTAAGNLSRSLRASHTLPLHDEHWNRATAGMARHLHASAAVIAELQSERSFNELAESIARFLSHRERVAAILLSLEPFEFFSDEAASLLLAVLDRAPQALAAQIERGDVAKEVQDELSYLAEQWSVPVEGVVGDRVQRAFMVDRPLVDEKGVFRAEWVLQHYAYRGDVLLGVLMPHLVSLGPKVGDLLAGVSIVGWIISSPDPVLAYVAFDALAKRFFAAGDAHANIAIERLRERESSLRRAQDSNARLWEQINAAGEKPSILQSLVAEFYVREIEGPFRQLVWAAHAVSSKPAGEVPTLGGFLDAVVAQGGAFAQIVKDVVMLDFRNSAAHETLAWDGVTNEYLTEAGRRVELGEVVLRALMARSAATGCEAAVVALNALGVAEDSSVLPEAKQMNRMPDWRRARGYFGTNNLRLLDAELHVRSASMTVERLNMADVNPCFQAILLTSTLIPAIESFAVTARGNELTRIEVSRSAVDANRPGWTYAVSNLDMMPLSAFLPMNFDARSRHEDRPTAVRSVAWVAADDVLGILDGSPGSWGDPLIELVTVRLKVALDAVRATEELAGRPEARLESVRRSTRDILDWIESSARPSPIEADALPAVLRLRLQWRAWAPVRRHPSVPDTEQGDATERQPNLRQPPPTPHFTTF